MSNELNARDSPPKKYLKGNAVCLLMCFLESHSMQYLCRAGLLRGPTVTMKITLLVFHVQIVDL